MAKSVEDIVDYNISDVFIPLKALRHLSKIDEIDDCVVRGYELFVLASLELTNIEMYRPFIAYWLS